MMTSSNGARAMRMRFPSADHAAAQQQQHLQHAQHAQQQHMQQHMQQPWHRDRQRAAGDEYAHDDHDDAGVDDDSAFAGGGFDDAAHLSSAAMQWMQPIGGNASRDGAAAAAAAAPLFRPVPNMEMYSKLADVVWATAQQQQQQQQMQQLPRHAHSQPSSGPAGARLARSNSDDREQRDASAPAPTAVPARGEDGTREHAVPAGRRRSMSTGAAVAAAAAASAAPPAPLSDEALVRVGLHRLFAHDVTSFQVASPPAQSDHAASVLPALPVIRTSGAVSTAASASLSPSVAFQQRAPFAASPLPSAHEADGGDQSRAAAAGAAAGGARRTPTAVRSRATASIAFRPRHVHDVDQLVRTCLRNPAHDVLLQSAIAERRAAQAALEARWGGREVLRAHTRSPSPDGRPAGATAQQPDSYLVAQTPQAADDAGDLAEGVVAAKPVWMWHHSGAAVPSALTADALTLDLSRLPRLPVDAVQLPVASDGAAIHKMVAAASMVPQVGILQLDADVVVHLCSMLPDRAVCRLMQTCKKFLLLGSDDALWLPRLVQRFPQHGHVRAPTIALRWYASLISGTRQYPDMVFPREPLLIRKLPEVQVVAILHPDGMITDRCVAARARCTRARALTPGADITFRSPACATTASA
jgi:hypothetical protein